MGEGYFADKRAGKRGRGAEGKMPVLGQLEREGRVKVKMVKGVSADSILKDAIKKVKKGALFTQIGLGASGLMSSHRAKGRSLCII